MSLRRRVEQLENKLPPATEEWSPVMLDFMKSLFGPEWEPPKPPDPPLSPEERAAKVRGAVQLVNELFGPRSRSDGGSSS